MSTCINCQLQFSDAVLHKQHYATDWHRYNLRRKVVGLPPVNEEAYKQTETSYKAENKKDEAPKKIHCKACNSSFTSSTSYECHKDSKKHIEKSLQFEAKKKEPKTKTKNKKSPKIVDIDIEDLEVEEIDSDEWDAGREPVTECLFCVHHSATMAKNLKHMSAKHSFYIPDEEYCVDLVGLMNYLTEKVTQNFECTWCSNPKRTGFANVAAVRYHMTDKGHTNMRMQGGSLMEYSDFYDYSSSYPDADSKDPDEEVDPLVMTCNGYELVLPSGAVVGSRALQRYYKQNVEPHRILAVQRSMQKSNRKVGLMAIAQKGETRSDVQRRARDIRCMQQVRAKHHMRLGIKANKFQPFLRPQVVF